jgi:HD-like signal output (HDOD) protein
MNRREEIIAKALAVPQMPMPVQKVMSILNDPGTTMTQLARLIEYEPGLTVNILRMANSAFFGGHGKVNTVKDAICVRECSAFSRCLASDRSLRQIEIKVWTPRGSL